MQQPTLLTTEIAMRRLVLALAVLAGLGGAAAAVHSLTAPAMADPPCVGRNC
jgi:hypothetical protein